MSSFFVKRTYKGRKNLQILLVCNLHANPKAVTKIKEKPNISFFLFIIFYYFFALILNIYPRSLIVVKILYISEMT